MPTNDQLITPRRPLKVRDASLAKRVATSLSKANITPNQISIFSIIFAALAATCLFLMSLQFYWWLPLLAAVFIQCRLLCNLFDGMVAVEGGKSTPAGELFNDIPDRVADPLILVMAGYAISFTPWGITAGWCAALLAVMTAYVRTLAASIGAPINFQGPMAKQQRMAVMTIACMLSIFEALIWTQGIILLSALIIIIFGCIITLMKRSYSAYRYLETRGQ